jgi:predicted nucleotidyltransferase
MRTTRSRRRVPALSTVAGALFGATRQAILALLFGRPDEAFYLREIARTAGVTASSLQRDLATLTDVGIIERTMRGNQVYFRANRRCPVFEDLRGLVVKTFGVTDVLREALAPLAPAVAVAFVHGSVARGDDRPGSDIDLVVVGEAKFEEVVEALRGAERRVGRELNPTVYPRQEFARKVRERNHFVATVLGDKKLFLIGGENELRDLAQGRLGQAAPSRKAGDRKPARSRRPVPR